MRIAFWLAGGVCVGLGILLAVMGGFGLPYGGPAATTFSQAGFDGLPELTIFPMGKMALAFFFGGVAMMIAGGFNAYKSIEGGY